jgi:hypothetical protein
MDKFVEIIIAATTVVNGEKFSCGSTAPIGPKAPHFRGFKNTTHSAAFLWMGDRLVTGTYT